MTETVPLFAVLESSLTMILGDEFEKIVFDPHLVLTEEEADYVRGFAKPFAIAMLFNELLRRFKERQVDITGESLKRYFTESTRDVCWLLGKPDPNEHADELLSIAMGFLEFNVVFDIDDHLLEPDDESFLTKFLHAVLPKSCSDEALQQRKATIVILFARVIEDEIRKVTNNIFRQTVVTLAG
jgi:hypothetical protein